MLYNQVEFSSATTATGAKTVLTTRALWPDSPTTEYVDTAATVGYYFGRFYNSITAAFSSYSDAMLVAGWSSSSVGYIIDSAFRDLEVSFSEKVTPQYCY